MRLQTALTIILPFFVYWPDNPYASIGQIPLPAGYERVPAPPGSFAAWLRQLPLKKDKTVHLYNGLPKINQSAQFAVLAVSVGDKDLQQCADAVMRLRAEYLYGCGRTDEIDFADNSHTHYRLPAGAGRQDFDQYLEKVFTRCGTLSLSAQLQPKDIRKIAPGDVFIYGASPGHAMLVTDVAVNKSGQTIFLLSQSYMPAQEIHVVVNPANRSLSPWYKVNEAAALETPEWTFSTRQLKSWSTP